MIYWKQVIFSAFVISLQQILHVEARSKGVRSGFCMSMDLSHPPNKPQSGPSPYVITTNATTYGANDNIQVTLEKKQASDPSFRGFLLQARVVGSDTPVGSFGIIADSQSYSGCTPARSAVTHTNKNTKDSMVFTWTAPSAPVGNIEFVVTIVQSYNMFWVKEKSSVITDPAALVVTTALAPLVPARDDPAILLVKYTVNKAHGMLTLSGKCILSVLVVFAAFLFRH